MKKLNLPIIKGDPMPSPILSMDAYLRFVEFMYKNTIDLDAYQSEKNESSVSVFFKLKRGN